MCKTLAYVIGLFLDQMMTDCHGLPFACMVKKQRTESLMDQSHTLYRKTQQQNVASKTMAATLFRQQSKISDNGGYNPSDMSAILKQNSNIFSNGGMSLNNGNTNSEQTNFMNKYVLSGESYHGNGNTQNSINSNNIQSSRNSDLNSEVILSGILTDNSNSVSGNSRANSLSGNGLSGSFPGLGISNSGQMGTMAFQGSGANSGNTIGTTGLNFFPGNKFQNGVMSQGFVNSGMAKSGISLDSTNRIQVLSSQSGDQGTS